MQGCTLKSRAAELGPSGAEVARRAELTATRYGHYLQDIRKPGLATLVRICRIFRDQAGRAARLRPGRRRCRRAPGEARGVAAYMDVLDADSLDLALPVVLAIAATAGLRSAPPAPADVPPGCEAPAHQGGATPKDAPAGR